jgi:N-acetylglucosaminyldiphosphoundecaprenol N-acetyl-beta-D-mannosaminyltransferase
MTAPADLASGPAPRPTVNCMGVPIAGHTPLSAAREIIRLALLQRDTRVPGSDGGSDVHLCNAYTLALADRNPELRAVLQRAALNLPDGQPVVWANQLLHRGTPLPATRVYGPDLFLDVFRLSQDEGVRHFLLGSTPEVLDAMTAELRWRFPRARIAGVCSPPFRPLGPGELDAQRQHILASGADLVWVGLGTPKQDLHAARLAAALPVVCVAVGAAFDFVAGSKPQAPRWMRRGGLEWTFRLGCEPRRLWRRYLFGNSRFVLGVARQAAGGVAARRSVQVTAASQAAR